MSKPTLLPITTKMEVTNNIQVRKPLWRITDYRMEVEGAGRPVVIGWRVTRDGISLGLAKDTRGLETHLSVSCVNNGYWKTGERIIYENLYLLPLSTLKRYWTNMIKELSR